MGVPNKLLKAIMSTYDNATEMIRVGKHTSRKFNLKNGLRQGSALSPLLYILYTSELIDILQDTGTGICLILRGNEFRIASLMFVDDLQTYSTSAVAMATQIRTIESFAIKTEGVLNKKKSSIPTSVNEDQMEEEKVKNNIKLPIQLEFVHLGAKHKPDELNRKENNNMSKSADVTFRIGLAKGALNIMIRNGLREGAIPTEGAKFIVNAVILQKLTYGLSYAYTTKLDEWSLEKVMADAARNIFNVDREEKLPDKWIIRDTGMTNPMDIIKINDIKLVLEAKKGHINTMVRDIILDSAPKLMRKTEKTCTLWGTTLTKLLNIKKKELNKTLLKLATKRPLNLLHPNRQLISEEELKINKTKPTYLESDISSAMIATYLQTRAGMHWGNSGEETKCPFCPNGPMHTYLHCINTCEFSITKKIREDYETELDQEGQNLPTANINELTKALTTPRHEHLQYFLTMIDSSPYL